MECEYDISKVIFGSVVGRPDLLVGSSFGGTLNLPEVVCAGRLSSGPFSNIPMWKTRGRPAMAYAYLSMKLETANGNRR
jgi:hypothetical protein